MKKFWSSWGLFILIFAIILLGVYMSKGPETAHVNPSYSYSTLISKLKAGEISSIEVQPNADNQSSGKVTAHIKGSDEVINVEVPSIATFMAYVDETAAENPELEVVTKEAAKTGFWISVLPMLSMLALAVFLLILIMQMVQGGGSGSRVMSFGKSKAKVNLDEKKKVTFDDVAGLDEEKEELSELVDFLKTPKKFVDLGARIPKGVLLVGPPGTGKTLLAKAVAGEAGAPFFSISGSDFVEMFVGVGASRVRDLFDQAKKSAPCIVFIDEIDAVGRRRGAGLGGGHDEREQTLNQLLVEMDGFGANEGVIVVAATNRPDILDPALLRPGRFDRQVVVGRPDVKGREDILKVHAKGKPFAPDVDLKVVAQTTSGFTGADLENLLNEAALLTARADKKKIDMEEIRRAFVKVGIGTEKKSRVIPKRERLITAYHEAGHGIIQELMPYLNKVHSISIIQTGLAAGYTMSLPTNDNVHYTKKRMLQEIVVLLGGRAAEYLVVNDITTGASSDIERATHMARSMVTRYGMSDELGPIQFGDDSNEVFIGRDLAHARNYGEEIASKIDREIKKIIDTAYVQAKEMVENHLDILYACAELLMEKEKITGEEFRVLFPPEQLEAVHKEHIEIYGEDIDEENTQENDIENSGEDKASADKTKERDTPITDEPMPAGGGTAETAEPSEARKNVEGDE